jgi:hypothetical protein
MAVSPGVVLPGSDPLVQSPVLIRAQALAGIPAAIASASPRTRALGRVFALALDRTRAVGRVLARTLDRTRAVGGLWAETLDFTAALAVVRVRVVARVAVLTAGVRELDRTRTLLFGTVTLAFDRPALIAATLLFVLA